MDATALRACLAALGWSQADLARKLNCREELVQRWARDAKGYGVPDAISDWLIECAQRASPIAHKIAALEQNRAAILLPSPPLDWKSGRGKRTEM